MDAFNPRSDQDRAYLAAALVAYALGLRVEVILSQDRGRPLNARARQIAMYLLYVGLGMSLARVALAFERDRSTVSYACRLIEEYREDADFDTWIEQLTLGLKSVARLAAGGAAA
jgi:chromosomal replication initiation ATPase DnaA